jgi:hypothetical protein
MRAVGLRWRRFGSIPADLGIDISAPGPFAVTAVLAACVDGGTVYRRADAALWEMSIGNRIASLVALAGVECDNEFDFVVSCPPPCRRPIETSITVDEVREVAARTTVAQFPVDIGGHTFVLRRPTGADQANWLAAGYPDADTARGAILGDLIIGGPTEPLSPAVLAGLERALDAHDPLLRCSIDVVCPFCATTSSHDLPLTDAAFGLLRRVQRELTRSVHTIASRYGWPESDILSLPRWRRDHYLSLIDQECS